VYVETRTEVLSIEDYMAPYVPFFSRSEAVELAQSYVVGLTLEGERKSVEPMSAKVHASERGMQRLLTEVKWDHEGVIRC
jgi:SRSO17 transposase